ncbi:MAG: sulfatase-like hydrolase/transferase [Candidatus Latescibacteria bacterium]|nr:sulfatase-like hydrolase/transferase [Candidatus Latescibacterota bacterium]
MRATRPNILWVCTDQQRWDTIGALGNAHISTPHIDGLVAAGTAFTRAYCQSPICTPSRASFLTGMYPSAVHVMGNGNAFFPHYPPLVTRLLADEGYDCGLIGKLHLSSAFGRIEARTEDGYEYWQYSHAPRDDWQEGHGYAEWVRSKGFDLDELSKDPEGVPAELHQTTWCAEKTIEFITQERQGPWLASVNIYDPHPPFNPPRSYRERYDPAAMPGPLFRDSDLAQQERLVGVDFQSEARRPNALDINSPILPQSPQQGGKADPVAPGGQDAKTLQAAYYAMIELIDDQVGRILAALEESGQRDDTVVIFTSDHGETLGDHGLIQKGCRFYEGLVRVPLIISWPGQLAAGRVSEALVELTDKAPTLLELAGLPVGPRIQGRSLLPLLKGEVDLHQHRDFVRCEYYDALDLPDNTLATMYRDQRYKLVLYHGHDLGELYDLEEDPEEFENMWDEPEAQPLKLALLQRSYDASMLAMDRGPERVGPM